MSQGSVDPIQPEAGRASVGNAADSDEPPHRSPAAAHAPPNVVLLALSALGIVYGDIGTSPLYAIPESFNPKFGLALARWRKKIFGVMQRNAQSATAFFNRPPNRVVELGAQIDL